MGDEIDRGAAGWHWCPVCRLASSRGGDCPGCGRAYVQVPHAGVPGTPYRPRLAHGSGFLTGAVSAVVAVAVVAAAAVGVTLLYTRGDTITASGQLVSPDSAPQSQKGNSSFAVDAFNGATLTLPGSWKANGTWGEDVAGDLSQIASPVSIDLSVNQGKAFLGIVNAEVGDPTQTGSEFLSVYSAAEATGTGATVSWSPVRDLVIGTYSTQAQDFTESQSGQVLVKGTFYAVSDTQSGELIIIETDASANQASILPALETALTAIP